MNDSKPFLPSIEYAKKLGVSKRRVNAMCQKGELEGAYKDGYRWMIPANCIEGKVGTGNYYIESRTRSTGAPGACKYQIIDNYTPVGV